MSFQDHPQAIVIGGGVIGASCAYHLNEAGLTDVLLFEKDTPASKASGRAAGHIKTYATSKREPPVSRYCEQFYHRLERKHTTVEFHKDSNYVISHTSSGSSHLRTVSRENSIDMAYLEPEKLKDAVSDFTVEGVSGALEYSDAIFTDPYSVTMGILEDAQSAGTEVRLEEIIELTKFSGDETFTLRTEERTYSAPIVVNATGAWSPQLASLLELSIPLKPRTSQIAVLRPATRTTLPMFHCPDFGLYGRSELNGDILIGGGTDTEIPQPDHFSTSASEGFLQMVAEKVPRIVDDMHDVQLINQWAGRCSATPDRLPLIGETSLDGFYVCAGFNGLGVAQAPFAGRLLADLAVGRPSQFSPNAYSPTRFASGTEFEVQSATTDW